MEEVISGTAESYNTGNNTEYLIFSSIIYFNYQQLSDLGRKNIFEKNTQTI